MKIVRVERLIYESCQELIKTKIPVREAASVVKEEILNIGIGNWESKIYKFQPVKFDN